MTPTQRPLLPFVTVDREIIADCRIFKVEKVHRRSQMSGQVHDYYCLNAPEWVNVLAVTPNDEVVLVRQERHGLEAFTIELPAGLVEPGEDPAAAALREMREETGFAADSVVSLGAVHPNPAIQGNRCHVFLARNVVRIGDQQLDGREEIEVQVVPFAKLRAMVRSGEVDHSLVLAALCLYDLKA